jgi:hypothetical protein
MARINYATRPPPGHIIAAASLGPPTPLVPASRSPDYLHSVYICQLVSEVPGSELIMMHAEYEDHNDVGADAAWGWASIRLGSVKSPS